MIRFNCLFVLAGVFQIITAQDLGGPRGPPHGNIPEKCRRPPQGVENPEQCCQIESIYSEEDFASCGFKKLGEEDHKERHGPPDCSKPICLMQRKGLVDENNDILWDDVEKYIRNQAGDDFELAANSAIETCVRDKNVPGPPQICEHARLMHCVGVTLFMNCPDEKWQKTDNCKALKDHMEECRPPTL